MTRTHTNRSKQIVTHLTVALLLTLGLGVALEAQTSQPAPQTAPAALTSSDVSDKELKNFVSAFIEVQEIRSEFQAKMASADDAQAAQQMQQEANAAMAEEVKANDLDIQRFNLVARSIGNDSELNARFQEAHKDHQSKAGQ